MDDKIRVDGANGLRFFSARRSKGCFSSSPLVNTFYDSVVRIPKTEINPNKAIFTIDTESSRILIVNNKACDLLGFESTELCNLQFSSLLVNKNKCHFSALAEGHLNSEDGTMVLLSGKVIEMRTKFAKSVAVSLWIRQINNSSLAVAEPVERRIAHISMDSYGRVKSGDFEAMLLFQQDVDEFKSKDVKMLIPAIKWPPEKITDPLPKHIAKQKATGKTKEGQSFPLCLKIERQDNKLTKDVLFEITVVVFNNMSGLIVIDENGLIESLNHHFSMLMFGYTQKALLTQNIQKLIPNFAQARSRNVTKCSLIDDDESTETTDPIEFTVSERDSNDDQFNRCLRFSTVNNSIISELSDDISNLKSLSSDTKSVNEDITKQSITENFIVKSVSDNLLNQENYENNRNVANKLTMQSQVVQELGFNYNKQQIKPLPTSSCSEYLLEGDCNLATENDLLTPVNEDFYLNQQPLANQLYSSIYHQSNINVNSSSPVVADTSLLTSNSLPKSTGYSQNCSQAKFETMTEHFTEGNYYGEAFHRDGNVINVMYTVSCQVLPSGKVYCVWICRDPDTESSFKESDEDEENNPNLTLTFNSITSTVENSLGQTVHPSTQKTNSRPNSISLLSQCEDDQIKGNFSKNYTTLKQIGKGAYGYVKMAYRNTDRLLVIAKFILKEKVSQQFMVRTDDDNREIPMEIYLLTTVKHPNIVSVLDVFENEKFFQLIMERHGCGMDLFEFIDRLPAMNEVLGSFIFRQIASAVDYLHSLKILHRDIKDENIIIDQNFHVKLIDFGSATFMEENGKLFSTFYGTTEYCSPEVLSGNKYAGPELEMWSLGVTLFVLIFFENPFVDIEDIVHAELIMPHSISTELKELLYHLLDKNPKTRCKMHELLDNSWLKKEINPPMLNFSHIIPCEHSEANPEKYFLGQTYSSGTMLSTISLADDDDSMIDVYDREDIDRNCSKLSGFEIKRNGKRGKCSQTSVDITKFMEINLNTTWNNAQRRKSMPPPILVENFSDHSIVSCNKPKKTLVTRNMVQTKKPLNAVDISTYNNSILNFAINCESTKSMKMCNKNRRFIASKSENNLFEVENLALITPRDGVVSSMTNLKYSYQNDSFQNMNDLSYMQLLTNVSNSDIKLNEHPSRPSFKFNRTSHDLNRSFNICNNKSNFQILSVSYNKKSEESDDENYDDENWDDEDDQI